MRRPSRETRAIRKTRGPSVLRYAKAKVVAETVKEVFRDLLSANDKSLANSPGQQKGSGQSSSITGGSDDSGKSDQKNAEIQGHYSRSESTNCQTRWSSPRRRIFFDTVRQHD